MLARKASDHATREMCPSCHPAVIQGFGEDVDGYCDTIVAVAEVIKLTDPSLLYLEVSTLVSKYPDIRYVVTAPRNKAAKPLLLSSSSMPWVCVWHPLALPKAARIFVPGSHTCRWA